MDQSIAKNYNEKDKVSISNATEKEKLMDQSKETPVNQISGYEDTRKTVYYFLERPESKIAIFYHLLNLLLIVGSIFTSILSTIEAYEQSEALKDLILYYELSLLSWISVEYILRAWSCSFLGKYKGFLGKLRFLKSLYMMIDAFVIVSTLTTAILSIKTAYFSILRITRFLQIFRILRLDRQRGDLRTMARVVYKHRKELVTCYFVGFIILFGSTYLIYIIEKSSAEDSTIDNMANGLYWAMITVTSVGYGDISPETWAGKLLTGIFALVGCAFFALPAGILGSGFALQVAKQKKQKRYIKVRNPAAIVIQTCWRNHAVMPHTYQLQGTWFYFFPQILGRSNNPAYYGLLPGLQDIVLADHFPQMMNRMVHEKSPRQCPNPFSRSSRGKVQNGAVSRNEGGIFRQKSSKAPHRKRHQLDMPLSTLLNKQYKEAIRFILRVKLFNAIKVFKNVRYPFVNVQDIMEKNALCHTETLSYLKHIQQSLEDFRCEIKEIRLQIQQHKILNKTLKSNDGDGDDGEKIYFVENPDCGVTKKDNYLAQKNSSKPENENITKSDCYQDDEESDKCGDESTTDDQLGTTDTKSNLTAEVVDMPKYCDNNIVEIDITKNCQHIDNKIPNEANDSSNDKDDTNEMIKFRVTQKPNTSLNNECDINKSA